jgi:hypothetical protein
MRTLETRMLGYAIERLDEFDDHGLPRSVRYEVLCPHTQAVLASRATLREARRFVLVHELAAIKRDAAARAARTRVA